MKVLGCIWILDSACIGFYGSECKYYISSTYSRVVCIKRSVWCVITRTFQSQCISFYLGMRTLPQSYAMRYHDLFEVNKPN